MKKIIILAILFCAVMCGFDKELKAHTEELDFYQMFEEHGTVMMLIDANTGEIEHANKAAADFYGYDVAELELMNIRDINSISNEEAENLRKKAISEGKDNFVVEQRLKNGEICTVEVYTCTHDQNGKTLIFAVIHDITDKVTLEQKKQIITYTFFTVLFILALLFGVLCFIAYKNYKKVIAQKKEIENFNKLRQTFIDADDSLIYLKDENLKYIFVNKAVERFYGKYASEIIGKSAFELAERQYAFITNNTDLEVIEKKKIISQEPWNNKVLQLTKFPVSLLSGAIGMGAYIKDITEEHRIKKELLTANESLKVSREKLQLILNSTAEAIYGIDLNGNCTFCNKSCIKILGYQNENELLGKNMHCQIHHSHKDGTPYKIEDCKIFSAIINGQGIKADDEVLWRADGSWFNAEYYSYPQFLDGKLVGAVVTFMDITSRKEAEREITYLSYHDSLTGLYNRRFFEAELKRLDTSRNLPISIIVGDVNGLKLTNDIFGHSEGDLLLQKAAQSMQRSCRADDIITRWGGDEFIIILPKTTEKEAQAIAQRIKDNFSKQYVKAFSCSISLGCDTKTNVDEDLHQTIKNAEEKMYSQKVLDRKNNSSSCINEIIETFYQNPNEKQHSKRVCEISQKIGRAMNLTEEEIEKLKDASLMHDIGKIIINKSLLNKSGELSEHEWQELKQHPIAGYKILNSSDVTMELANCILSHHEKWDGTGYPKNLSGKSIPKLARIIAIAESYDAMINDTPYKKAVSKEQAINQIQNGIGKQFDPYIAEIFINLLKKEEFDTE